MKKALELPPTLRSAYPDEIPTNSDASLRLAELEKANIAEGYIIKQNDNQELPFIFFAEININNQRLWDLFLALSEQLPDVICPIYNLYCDDAVFGNYASKEGIITSLSNFELELTQDCDLEFGLIFHDKESLTEVFVPQSKYVQFWGKDEIAFVRIMQKFNLQSVQQLNFIDEYPKVIIPLINLNSDARNTNDILAELNKAFSV